MLLAHRVQRRVLAYPAARRAAQPGRHLRLPAAQHGLEQVDGGEVREPGHRQLGQFLGGTGDVQAGADAHTGVVQHVEALAGLLGAAGQGPQLGRVAERGDAAGRAAPEGRGALVDRQQPVLDQVHLVRGDPAGGQQLGGVGGEAEVEHPMSLGVLGQIEQTVRLVVGEQQPPLGADDDHTLPDGVQDGVVVLVHPGHLVRPEAVGLPQQPLADQRRARRGQSERHRRGDQQQRQLPIGRTAHGRLRHPGRHQPDDLAVGVLDGHDRLHQRPDGARDLLDHDAPGQRGLDGPDERLPDAVRLGMGVADAFGVHDDDEVHVRRLARRLGPRLQHGGGIRAVQRLPGARRVRERLGDRHRTMTGLLRGVVAHLQHQCRHRGDDQQQHDHHLQQEHLTGEAAPAQRRPHCGEPPLVLPLSRSLARQPSFGHPRGAVGRTACALTARRKGRPGPGATPQSDHVPMSTLPGRRRRET